MGWTRRLFLVATAAVAGGVAVGAYAYRKPFENPLAGGLDPGEVTLNPYVTIGADGRVTIVTPRAEMGQGSQSALAKLVAEELDVPFESIVVEHGPASRAYLNWRILGMSLPFPEHDKGGLAETARGAMHVMSKFLGHQITGGSSAIVDAFDTMRLAGAAARAMLLEAAAKRMGVPAATLVAEAGAVSLGDQRFTYGELAADAAKVTPPDAPTLKGPDEWVLIGKTVPRKDIPAKVDGSARFGIDVRRPGMLHAAVRLSPVIGAPMTRFDAAKAKAMPGVVDVIDISGEPWGGGVAVVAKTTWHAFRALDAVAITWGEGKGPKTTAEITAALDKGLGEAGYAFVSVGDPAAATGRAVEATYSAPLLAHTCMEPMNATAVFEGGRFTIWTGTQVPTLVQDAAARHFGGKPEDTTVVTELLGGGFGRRLEVDYAVMAMRVAKAMPGKTVKVTWSREEDVQHDVYRPPAKAKFRAVLGADGHPVALSARAAAPSLAASYVARVLPSLPLAGPDRLIAEGIFDQTYRFAAFRAEGTAVPLALPVGNWRSVGNSHNAFFMEGFLDEVARAGGVDPVAMRLKLLDHDPVDRAVLAKVAEMAKWTGKPTPGRGRGVAMCRSFGSMVAEIVDVVDTGKGLKVEAVHAAIEVGRAIDPGAVVAQVESAILYGLSAAILQEITLAGGKVEQSNFSDFDALRINQAPRIEVAILTSQAEIGGVGEPGTPPAAPALANAIFDLTGKRLRAMPFSREVAFA